MAHVDQGEQSGALSTAAAALSRGPVPLSQAVKIVDRLCEILGGMHVAGRAHGAIHAATVRFRHVGGQLDVALDPTTERPATYTPPELAQGHPATSASDIYQVGVLFHHLIAGVPPFDGGTDATTHELHRTTAPASLERHELQDVPVELDRLILTMLAKNPNARPKNVQAIRAQIANLELDSTVMGLRLSALRDVAVDLGAATPEGPEEEPTRLQELPTVGENDVTVPPEVRPPIDPGPAVVPQSGDVDPFADTFIRNRAEFELDGDETQMSLPPERRPSAPTPQVFERVVAEPPTAPTAPNPRLDSTALARVAPPLSTAAAVAIGVAVFVVTLAVILWIAG